MPRILLSPSGTRPLTGGRGRCQCLQEHSPPGRPAARLSTVHQLRRIVIPFATCEPDSSSCVHVTRCDFPRHFAGRKYALRQFVFTLPLGFAGRSVHGRSVIHRRANCSALSNDLFAMRQLTPANGRCGSTATDSQCSRDVRFPSNSDQIAARRRTRRAVTIERERQCPCI
jgi:hypothetical protein